MAAAAVVVVAVVSVAMAVLDGTESFPFCLTLRRRTSRRFLLRLLEYSSH
jgi:hypothetical protein